MVVVVVMLVVVVVLLLLVVVVVVVGFTCFDELVKSVLMMVGSRTSVNYIALGEISLKNMTIWDNVLKWRGWEKISLFHFGTFRIPGGSQYFKTV